MSMLAIGVTGLNAAQLGLITTEHNITNANTEGFNRQRTVQATNIPMSTGSGFLGQGVNVQTVQRLYNGFVAGQVAQSATRASELDTYLDQVTLIDNMLADPSSGLSPALQDFFRGVQQVAADPASLPARQAMVSATEALVSRFHTIEQRLAEQYVSVNEQIESHVGLINSYAEQIAEMNQRIVVSQAATGQPANDLLDQRDTLISKLNDEIRVTTVLERDGSLNVFAGNGQQLVVGVTANRLAAVPSLNDPERFTVAMASGVSLQELPESVLQGGALGGLLRFRTESLDPAANSLGRIAASMALTFNAQHALGQDLLGNIAGAAAFVDDYFKISPPKVVASQLNTGTPAITAAFIEPPPLQFNNGDFAVTVSAAGYEVVSQKYGIAPGSVVQPTLELALRAADALPGVPAIDPTSGNFFTNLTTSDYRVQFDTTGTTFTVTRLSDRTTVPLVPPAPGAPTLTGTPGVTYRFEGMEFTIGASAANDVFTIQPTREVARNLVLNSAVAADPRLIAAAGPVRAEVGSTNTGSGKIDVLALAPGYVAPLVGAPVNVSFSVSNVPILNQLQLTIDDTTSANITITSGGVTVPAARGTAFNYTADAIITVDGLSFRISGAPKTGDSFTLQRNTNGVADSRNALALGQLQIQDTMAGGKTSFQGSYAQLVSQVGNKTREIQVTGAAQKSLLDQAIAAREAQSGVNLDEEAANLIRYQQAYQAAARVIDVGSRLFDVILSIR